MDTDESNTGAFRDHLANVTPGGKRIWIYPRKQDGRYYRWRTWLSWIYLAVFFLIPFLRINGHPFILVNIPERHYVLFGQPFWPQDFDLFCNGHAGFYSVYRSFYPGIRSPVVRLGMSANSFYGNAVQENGTVN